MHTRVPPQRNEIIAALLSLLGSPHPRPLMLPYLEHDPNAHRIRPCVRCEGWWAELVRDSHGQWVVREWHDDSCAVLREIEWE